MPSACTRSLQRSPAQTLSASPAEQKPPADEVMSLLQTLHRERGITVILVTHDAEVARHTSRIIQLYDGQVTHQERVA